MGKETKELLEQDREQVLQAEDSLAAAIELVQKGRYNEYEDNDSEEEDNSDEQPIIAVTQDAVKRALSVFLTKENNFLSHMYAKHTEYNERYFDGLLSFPLITTDKMSNKTLADYQPGTNEVGIENHIRLNRNFVALNEMARVERTLLHEMIHQWQDEVLYMQTGQEPKPVRIPTLSAEHLKQMNDTLETGFPVTFENGYQPKRPKKNWHDRYFRAMASYVGIPAKGSKCTQDPVEMPEAKSYNRKFACECVASNGKPVTIWSTREVHAKCMDCGSIYNELQKSGAVVKTSQSHVERDGEDGVQTAKYKEGYTHFERFKDKVEQKEFIETLGGLLLDEGHYQTAHNSYKEGYRYWVAYIGEVAEEPTEDETEGFCAATEASEEAEYVYSADKAEDILTLYKMLGTTRKVAEYFGIGQSTLMGRAKKLGVNFKEGRLDHAGV